MKNIFSLFICLVFVQTIIAQDFSDQDFYGKWYQCEESDGKVIKLFKEKCYSESLNKDSTKGAFNLSQSTDWNFNRLG